MADDLPTLKVLDKVMHTGYTWMYRQVDDLDGRFPAHAVMLPPFRLLEAMARMLNLLNTMSLEVIADNLCIRRVGATTVVQEGSNKAPKIKLKKVPKSGVAAARATRFV